MCGITAIFHPYKKINPELLLRSVHSLRHRGPDGENIWISRNGLAGLGHTHLSIIGTDRGNQPISDSEERYAVSVNGEIYNYKEIRKNLIRSGSVFRTDSDSEVILHLYRKYGREMMRHLRGEFAFAVYDGEKNLIFAARDRFGIKPLHFHLSPNGTFYTASEAKALHSAGITPEWDHYSLYHSMTLQYLPQDRTLFKGIFQLKPGHFLEYSRDGLRTEKYWDINFPVIDYNYTDDQEFFEADYEKELEKKLIESVQIRLQSDNAAYCSHLSGGIDSSLIAALAARFGKQKLHCFTVSFPGWKYDEASLAEKTAQHIGANFTAVAVTANDLSEALSDAVYFSEGNAINSHLAAKFILNRTVRKEGYKIALTGEGSDEILAGYLHLLTDLKGRTESSDRGVLGIHVPAEDLTEIPEFQTALGFTPSFIQAKILSGRKIRSLLTDEFKHPHSEEQILKDFINSLNIDKYIKNRNKADQSAYIWIKFTLANYILKTLGDGTEMAHGIEGRVPFLDHILAESAVSIPISLKIRDGVQKHVLRQIARKFLPIDVTERPKQAFMAPPFSLLNDRRGIEFAMDCFQSADFRNMGIFDSEKIMKMAYKISQKTPEEQTAEEPCIMLPLTACLAGNRFHLS